MKKSVADDMPKFGNSENQIGNGGIEGIYRHTEGAANSDYGSPPEYNNVNNVKM